MMCWCRAPPIARCDRSETGADGSTLLDDSRPPGVTTGPEEYRCSSRVPSLNPADQRLSYLSLGSVEPLLLPRTASIKDDGNGN
jgi:hypothetical protein